MPSRSAHPRSGGKPKKPRRTKKQIETAKKKAAAARRYHLKTKHHMTVEQYQDIKIFQNELCPLCLRANGATKHLAVDHDHRKATDSCGHPHQESCAECWRGLLCGPCNDMLSHARDDPHFFLRAAAYLTNPPAQQWRQQLVDSIDGEA